VGGVTLTAISEEITTSASTDKGFLINLPLTQTSIKAGQKLFLEMEKSGGAGNFTIDPLNLVSDKQTTILNIPFRIDL